MNNKVLSLLIAAALMFSCSRKNPQQESIRYKTKTVEASDVNVVSNYSARLEGQQTVEVRPEVGGLIKKICIHEGDKVKRGQVLFVINPVPYRAAYDEASANVKSAEAQLATAQLTMENTEALWQHKVVGDYELKTARNALAAARASLAQAKAKAVSAAEDLDHTEVKSPVDGVAGMIAYRVGALVSSSIQSPLVTVTDDSRIYAYFSLTESQVTDMAAKYGSMDSFVKNAPAVTLKMAGGKDYPTKGRISAVSGIVTEGTGAITMRADFDNPDRLLRGGGSATVCVPNKRSGCLVIPQGATYELQNKTFAYKIVDGKPQSTQVVVTRLNNGTDYIVESGLKSGDVIISEGAGLVKN
ncbi:MAG: efflux RND transporter periplasmic adaptor subunit [Prevotella sp.]